jgi:hypothetical protein
VTAPTTRATVDLDPSRPTAYPRLAFALALLAIPGVVLTWGAVPGGGFTTGVPLAIVAIILGIRARPGRMATAAVVIGAVCFAFVAIWTVASAL